jgi:hypothetical protein
MVDQSGSGPPGRDPRPSEREPETAQGRVAHEDHGLGDNWSVTLRAEVEDRAEALRFERNLGYGDGAAVIERLRAAGRSHSDALAAFWRGLARTAAAELAYELSVPDVSRRPRSSGALRDPGGYRVFAAAADQERPARPPERGEVLCPIGVGPGTR